MAVTQFLGVAIGLSVLIGIVYFVYISEAHGARPWRKRQKQLMDLAKEYGLQVDESTCRASGEFEGFKVSLGIKSHRLSKSKVMRLWARLELENCPPNLQLQEESVLSGVGQLFGSEELALGDPEFDAAFEVLGSDLDEVRAYLTPQVRGGLLHGLPRLDNALVKEGAVTAHKGFHTPVRLNSHLRPLLDNLRFLAQAMRGTVELPSGGSGVVKRKIRTFVRSSLMVWLPLFALSFNLARSEGLVIQGLLLLGVVFTVMAYSASELTRVLLQGFYAFLGLALTLLLVIGLGEAAELLPTRLVGLDEDEVLAFLIVTTLLGVTCWGIRNYLKTLDQTRAVASDAQGVTL